MNSQLDRFLAAENERNARDAEYFIRGQIVAICEAVLAEEIGVIAGSRRLNRLGLDLYGARDPDFITFAGVDSETDHLPVDAERANWSAEALERKDAEIAQAQKLYQEDVFLACRKLIERFRLKPGKHRMP